ncbi:MAG TPA: M20/M25/M40 family metallo-hydrolase [Gemmatimonadaceae bacterium]|nr:M20/M25/M40 family metallo-hydrolase [Gemmatimonadaceae bacterium]
MRSRTYLMIAVLLAAPVASHSQALSPAERRIVSSVDANSPAGVSLLERLVNINSGTHNFAGVRAVADALAPEFQKLGFTTRWSDGTSWSRAGHLIAEWKGNGTGRKLLLIGHLDTVFERDSPFQRFERVGTDSARGPGIADMKGGNVVMLLALKALKDAGLLEQLQVTAVITGDEEDSGRPIATARADLTSAADWADIALGFENGPEAPHVAVIARRGSTTWWLRTSGMPSHSSQVFRPEVGSGAIYEMARVLAAFHDSLSNDPPLTFNPGVMVGGTTVTFDAVQNRGTAFGKTNVVAESAYVAGDLRALTPEQLARAKATMQRLAARHYPRTNAVLTIDDGYPPFAPTDGNRRLLAILDQGSRDAGLPSVGPVDPARAGAADISFVAGRVEAALDGLGLKGRADHTVNETADLNMLAVQAKRAAILMARLGTGREK